ncbi:MAG: carbonic anhydrase [Caulobacter sp.]
MSGIEGKRRLSRRGLLGGLILGAGLGLGVAPVRASGHAEALLLTCMDFRLVDEVESYMEARGLKDRYDHMVLAGASLGGLNDRFPTWGDVFWAHLDLAIELHEVHRVIVLDHRDCGAYKMILGEASVKDADAELKTHVKQLYAFRSAVLTRHPHMEVEIGLMALDGTVTQIV